MEQWIKPMWVSKIIKYKKNGLESLFVFTGTFAVTSFCVCMLKNNIELICCRVRFYYLANASQVLVRNTIHLLSNQVVQWFYWKSGYHSWELSQQKQNRAFLPPPSQRKFARCLSRDLLWRPGLLGAWDMACEWPALVLTWHEGSL